MPEAGPKKVDGYIISVQGPVVDVRYIRPEDVPNIYSIINAKTVEGKDVILEVAEHRAGNIARCISLNSTQKDRKSVV